MHCDLCDGDAAVRGRIEGYRAGTCYEVIACTRCGTSAVSPRRSDEAVYDAIYRNADVIPSYARYHWYATDVANARDPLRYLMDAEDGYAAVGAALLAAPTRVVAEIGCGQGYFTYALSRAGINAVGFDLSSTAVAAARARFGNLFHNENARDWLARSGTRASHVVLCEVLEHVVDPVRFLEDLLPILEPGGSILLTTPRRESWAADVLWNTELPPVHLWWFTSAGIHALGARLGCSVAALDTRQFYERNAAVKFPAPHVAAPTLDSAGNPLLRVSGTRGPLSALAQRIVPWPVARAMRRAVRRTRARSHGWSEFTHDDPLSLCVRLTPR